MAEKSNKNKISNILIIFHLLSINDKFPNIVSFAIIGIATMSIIFYMECNNHSLDILLGFLNNYKSIIMK